MKSVCLGRCCILVLAIAACFSIADSQWGLSSGRLSGNPLQRWLGSAGQSNRWGQSLQRNPSSWRFTRRQSAPPPSCRFQMFLEIGKSTYFGSPGYPENYPKNADCAWVVDTAPNGYLRLNCREFFVEQTTGCHKDVFMFSKSGGEVAGDAIPMCGSTICDTSCIYSNTCDDQKLCGVVAETQRSRLVAAFRSDDTDGPGTANMKNQRFICQVKALQRTPPPPKPPPNQPENCRCGIPNMETRVVNGRIPPMHKHPWLCAITTTTTSPDDIAVFCGCVIITMRHVLTASHCLQDKDYRKLMVDVGDHDVTTRTEAQNRLVKVRRSVMHPQYDKSNLKNDIAILELEEALTPSYEIREICLPFRFWAANFIQEKASVVGWGTYYFGGAFADKLEEVELNILTTEECRKYHNSSTNMITDNMFCTLTPGKDACQGDSGGPLIYFEQQTGVFYVIGVISWGVGCAANNKPGVYTKVFKQEYLDWIEKETGIVYCKH